MLILLVILAIVAIVIVGTRLFMRSPQFGRPAAGVRLERIRQSPQYRDGQFQNISHTPPLAEGATYYGAFRDFFFNKSKRVKPAGTLPSEKTDLRSLPPEEDVLVWFGHSSYFIQLDGKKMLVDPVLSGHASPVNFTTRSFAGSDIYTAAEIPDIDYLFITHDHYDHLDYGTIKQLQPKVKRVITGLGTGAHLEHWGFPQNKITELDWNEAAILEQGFTIYSTPARHFSGRGFKRNISLWLSFVLQTPTMKLFIGGDSGYDSHFMEIGKKHGPFDLAILENGQYNESWKYIHMMPEETVQAAIDLHARRLLPVHWSKFALSLHAWDEPVTRVEKAAKEKGMPLLLPMIGQTMPLKSDFENTGWWTKGSL
ncbi:MAG: MBL fold metallo-hydrolase [Bacteroidetes bacterium]|nr:MBL fold metallo-hydrolase [Bacteroidota bacterium]